jgi:hypothetical protein
MSNTWIWVGRDVSTAIAGWERRIQEEGVVYRERVKPGDRLLWWKSGKGAGVYGLGMVTGSPYSAGLSGWHKREYRFPVRIEKRFPASPLLRDSLRLTPGLRSLVTRLSQQRPNPREVTKAEWELIRAALASPPPQVAYVAKAGGGFGETTSNARVEKAAIAFTMRRLKKQRWSVKSVEADGCGFDLVCVRAEQVVHMEVKGTSGPLASFILTSKERSAAEHDPLFMLAIVTSATTRPRLQTLSGKKALTTFAMTPLSFICRPKHTSAG